jgi:anti-sigma B factor antagonist
MNENIQTHQISDDRYIISIVGEIDLYNAPTLKAQLLEAVDQGARHIVIDMTDTTFIDSTTLGVLISGLKRLRSEGGSLSIAAANTDIAKIFAITGLDRVFTIYATREEAVGEMSTSSA